MTRAPFALLAVALLLIHLPIGDAQAFPGFTAEPAQGDMATRFAFAATAPPVTGATVLANGEFKNGVDPWRLDIGGLLGSAEFDVTTDGLRLRVSRAQGPTSAGATQTVAVNASTYNVGFTARVDGTLERLLLVMRETAPGGRSEETVFFLEPSSAMTAYSVSWSPKLPDATSVDVRVRAAFDAGHSATVIVQKVTMQPTTTFTWDLRDGTAPRYGSSITHRFATFGLHEVTLTRTDPGTAPQTTRRSVLVEDRVPIAAFNVTRLDGGLFVADARASYDPDGISAALVNGNFSSSLDGWTFRAAEIGDRATADAANDSARIRIRDASARGSVFLSQTLPIESSRAYSFQTTIRDDGGIVEYAFILREEGSARGSYDHVFIDPPVNATVPRDVRHPFKLVYADTERVTIHLRAIVAQGRSADVWFDDVRLVDALDHAWTLDGVPLSQGPSPRIEFRPTPGTRVLGLTVTDIGGASARKNISFDASVPSDATPSARIEAPLLAHIDTPFHLSALPSALSSYHERLRDGDFGSLTHWQVAGTDAAALREEGVVTLSTPAGTIADLMQSVPITAAGASELRVTYRNVTPVLRVELLLTEYALDADGNRRPASRHETILQLPPSESWTTHRARWGPVSQESGEVVVRLRIVATDAPASVEFDHASLGPSLAYEWTVGKSAPVAGYSLVWTARSTETLLVTMEVTDTAGRSNATSVSIPIIPRDAVTALPRAEGGATITWSFKPPPTMTGLTLERRAGTDTTNLPIPLQASGAIDDLTAPVGVPLTYALTAHAADGKRAVVGEVNIDAIAAGQLAVLDTPERFHRLANSPIAVRAAPDIVSVQADVKWGPFTLDALELKRGADDVWRAEYTPGVLMSWPAKVHVVVTGTTTGGRAVDLAHDTVAIETFGAADAWIILGGIVLPFAAFGVRRARKRRWPAWMW